MLSVVPHTVVPMLSAPRDHLLLAWDIDGTLVRAVNRGSARASFSAAATHVLSRQVVVDFSMSGMTDRQIAESILLAEHAPLELAADMLSYMDASISEPLEYEVQPAPGAREAVGYAHESGHTNVLLTGNSPVRARRKLLTGGYDLSLFNWDLSAFGSTTPRRADLADAVARAAAGRGEIAVVIGDTPADAEAAASAGLAFVAVASGWFSEDELAAYQHNLLISDFDTGMTAFSDFLAETACTAVRP